MARGAHTLDGEPIVADLWPAEATLPDGTYLPRARVVVTSTCVLVFNEQAVTNEHGRVIRVPNLAFHRNHEDDLVVMPDMFRPNRARLLSVQFDGKELKAAGRSGCGCGSSLKAFNPQLVADAARWASAESEAGHLAAVGPI